MSGLREYLELMVRFRNLNFDRPDGFAYDGIEDFMLKHGAFFEQKKLTSEEREHVRAAAYNRKFYMKQCFKNSQSVALDFDHLGFRYVEGYSTGLIPVYHGWLALNGKVIDLTMREYNPKTRKPVHRPPFGAGVLGTWKEPREYLGVEIPKDLVRARVLRTKEWGPIIDDWKAGYPYLRQHWISLGRNC